MPKYRVQTDSGVLMVESPTPISDDAQMQKVVSGQVPGVTVSPEAPEQPVSQGFLQKVLGTPVATGGAAVGLRGLLGGEKPLAEMTPEERQKTQSPLTAADAGRLALPFLVNRFVPAGRTVTRIGGQILGNVAGSAGLEGVQEAAKGRSFLGGAIKGAAQGVPGGVLQGVLGGILGPNRTTLQAQKANSIARLKKVFSPEVAAQIPEDPKALFSRGTVDRLVRTAGEGLDRMEQTIHNALAPKAGLGAKNLQAKFDFLRERIKSLRDIGEGPRATPELRGKAKQASQEAQALERQLEQMLEKNGFPQLATLYQDSIQRFARDRAQIRVLKAIQRGQSLPGGVNRADNPQTAEFVDAVQAPTIAPQARLAFASLLFAFKHPFIAIGELNRLRSGIRTIDPNKIRSPLSPHAGAIAATGGAAASLAAKDQPNE